MSAKLLTRPDVIKLGELDSMLKELSDMFVADCNKNEKLNHVTGAVKTVVEILKTGHRDDLLSRCDNVFNAILKTEITNTLSKKSVFLKKARVNLA